MKLPFKLIKIKFRKITLLDTKLIEIYFVLNKIIKCPGYFTFFRTPARGPTRDRKIGLR